MISELFKSILGIQQNVFVYKGEKPEEDNNKMSPRQRWLFYTMGALPFLGVMMIIICAFNFLQLPFKDKVTGLIITPIHPYLPVFITIGYGILIGGAAYVAGGFGGFLFGLPRFLSNPDNLMKGNYSRNDNLIQISDWLTKIIVGLGLTNLYKIPHQLTRVGAALQILFGDNWKGAVTAEAIVVYFLVCGFLFGYLWTNIQYIPILTEADRTTQNLAAQQAAKERIANDAIDAHTDTLNSTDPNLLQKLQQQQQAEGKAELAMLEQITALIKTADAKMIAGTAAQRDIPVNMRDPNKYQWGGKAENKGRKVSATVSPVDGSGLFRIIIKVEAVSSDYLMQNGDVVLFALHSTFTDPYKLAVVKNHTATLECISSGAFTVGIIDDKGNELEYDLTTIPGAPDKFVKS